MQLVQKPPGNVRARIALFAVAFFLFYFGQKMGNNFEGLSKIPVRNALLKDFALPTSQVGALMTSISVGWYIKALLGVVTDGLPIFGLRRKPYLLLGNLLASGAWFWVASSGTQSVASLALGLTLVNIGVAFTDVVVDGLMVQSAQTLEQAGQLPEGQLSRSFQSWQWAGANVAVTLAALGGGVIASVGNISMSATISGVALLCLLPVVFLIKEERVPWNPEAALRGSTGLALAFAVGGYYLWANRLPDVHWYKSFEPYASPLVVIGSMLLVVRIPRNLWAPIGLIFLWQSTPFLRDSTVFQSYFTQDNQAFVAGINQDNTIIPLFKQLVVALHITTQDKLAADGFQTMFYGSVIETVAALTGLLACLVTVRYLSKMPFGSLFRWCLFGNAVSFVSFMFFPMGNHSPILLMLTVALAGFVYMTAVLAVVGYAAARTPTSGGQASVFAFLMGMSNLGQQLGVESVGAWLYTHYGHPVTEGLGEAAVTHLSTPDNGFSGLAMIGLLHLAVLWAAIGWLERRGYVDVQER